MKKELENIVRQELRGFVFENELLSHCIKLIAYYEEHSTAVKSKLQKVIAKYNYNNISKFSESPEYYPHLTFFKTIGEYEISPCIDYEGGISDSDKEIGTIIESPEIYPEMEFENFEDELLFEEARFKYHELIFFTWLSLLWQEVNGWNCGIVAKTLENNSVTEFCLNDFTWDQLSVYFQYNDFKRPIPRYFKRDLNILEISQRVSLGTYPHNPYRNNWRLFVKGDAIKELVFYGHETGERSGLLNSGKENLNIRQHDSLKKAIEYINATTKTWMEAGYVENNYPGLGREPIYEGAIETKFHSGVNWYQTEMKNRLDISQVEKLEADWNIQLPFHFKHYLRLFNGRKYNKHKMVFRLTGGGYLKMKEFYDLKELNNELEKAHLSGQKTKWLNIGFTLSDEQLKLNINPQSPEFGSLRIQNQNGDIRELETQFADFIKETV